VLLDTLVVRPVLVPTFLILLQGRRQSPLEVSNSPEAARGSGTRRHPLG
jgi:hypothetical protein